ncbi:hypothetical protein SUGI_0781370 [Cryptomeria japonica]|nr:hypothetical protein SUGI_0781370 [Cryptomeria japonica]
MLLLITISLLQPVFSRGCGKSAIKRGRLSMEYLKPINQQIEGETASQEKGHSGSLGQRKMKSKFQCKRQIPGGPDRQHH